MECFLIVIHREKVHIPENKPYIFLRGNGRGRTSIVWSQSSKDNIESATFKVKAPHVVIFGISFKVRCFFSTDLHDSIDKDGWLDSIRY